MAYRSGSIVGAAILIGLGVLFLYSNSHPNVDAWYILARYWPILLIISGVGKLWDYYAAQRNPEQNWRWVSGGEIAAIVLVILFIFLVSRHHSTRSMSHQHQTIDYGSAKSVNATIQMPEGELQISNGAPQLLDADLDYSKAMDNPNFSYDVDGDEGELLISQEKDHEKFHFGPGFGGHDNRWNIRFGKKVPMELKIMLGAGRTNLQLGDLPLTKLDIQMGAGSVTTDLRGNWKNDLDAHIQGGVGSATIYLPKNVGVEIHAHGGIGSVNAHGMQKDGDRYVNDAYGKSSNTIELHVEGGVGSIDLIPEM
jgi:hypothetical protein